MAYNFRKHGYSTAEVAQMLNCCVSNVWYMVKDGKIKADVSEPASPGGRRKIRITREQLIDYLQSHTRGNSNYIELLKAFKPSEQVATTPRNDEVKKAEPSFIAGATKEPSGVWANLSNNKPELLISDATKTSETNMSIKDVRSCSLIVDGRICVANIAPSTASNILNCLLADEITKIGSITIKMD